MEDKVTIKQIAIRWGLIVGLVFIVYGMILQFLNLEMKTMQYFSYLNYVILIVVFVLAHKAFKEGRDGFMSIGQGIGIGTLIALIASVLNAVFSYIYLKFIDDSMLTKIKDAQIEQYEKMGMDDAAIERSMEMAGKFMTPELIQVWGILGTVLFGFILALIVSLFTKKSNPALEV